MADRETQAGGTGVGSVLLAWVGAGVGVVLLVRLAVQGVRAAGYGAAWLENLVLSELVSGLRLSLFDLVIVLAAGVIGLGSALTSRRDTDGPADEH